MQVWSQSYVKWRILGFVGGALFCNFEELGRLGHGVEVWMSGSFDLGRWIE